MRSILLAAAAALVLTGLAAAPAAASGPALSVPAAQLAASLQCTGDLSAGPTPVLLVPGTGEDPDFFAWNYVRAFKALGTPLCTVTLPEHGTADIQVAAEYVVSAIRTMHEQAGRRIAVVGHSQGGMVPRWALRWWPDTRDMVDDLVGLAASNHGTDSARTVCGMGCNAATWQQMTGSKFITALNAPQETYAPISYTSVFTRFDEIVTPNQDEATGSTALRTGDGRRSNVRIQDLCPNDTADHLVLGSSDPVGYALTIDALTHDGPADAKRISPTVCTKWYQPGVNPATYPTDATTSYATVIRNFSSGKIVQSEPPLKCYVTGTCADGTNGSGSGSGSGSSSRRARPALRISVAGPRRLRAGHRATLRVRVRALRGGRLVPVAGARIALAGRVVHTGSRGSAAVRKRFVHRGKRTMLVTRAGFRSARRTLRVVR